MRDSSIPKSITLIHTPYEPYTQACAIKHGYIPSRKCLFPGIIAESVIRILESLKIQPLFRSVPTELSDTFGVIQARLMFVNQSENYCLTHLRFTPLRAAQYALPKSVVDSPFVGVYSTNVGGVDLFGFLSVFDISTWITFALLLFFFQSVSHGYSILRKADTHHVSLGKKAENCLIVVSFFVALTMSMYDSGLLSKLLIKRELVLFTDYNGMVEVVRSGTRKMVTLKGSSIDQDLQGGSLFPDLTEAFANNPITRVNTDREETEKLLSGSYIILGNELTALTLQSQNPSLKYVVFSEFQPFRMTMVCNRNISSRFIAAFNEKSSEMKPYLDGIAKRYMDHALLLNEQRRNSQHDRLSPIRFIDAQGIFLIIALGCSVAAVCFCAEIVIRYIRDRSKYHVDIIE